MAETTQEVKKNRKGAVAISWITIIVQAVLSIVFTPVFLRTVGDRQYGLYSFATSIIAWLTTLLIAITGGYYKFLTREREKSGPDGEKRADSVFARIYFILAVITLIAGIGFDALLYFGAIPLPEYSITEKNQICILVLMSIISTFVTTAFTAGRNFPYHRQKYIFVYTMSLLEIVISTAISFVVLKLAPGELCVLWVALAHFGSSIFFTFVIASYSKFRLKQEFIPRRKDQAYRQYRKSLTREILVFSCFVIIGVVAEILNRNMDKTILGIVNPDLVANYSLSFTFVSYLVSFTSIIGVVFSKGIVESFYLNGAESMNPLYLKASKIQSLIACAIVGGFIAVGQEFITIWLKEYREQVYFVAVALLIIYAFPCSQTIANASRQMVNIHHKSALITLMTVLGNIAFSLIFVFILPRDQAILACVIGTAISSFIGDWVVMPLFDTKKTGLNVKKFYVFFLFVIVHTVLGAFVINKVHEIIFPAGLHPIVGLLVKGFLFLFIYLGALVLIDSEIKAEAGRVILRIKGIFIKKKPQEAPVEATAAPSQEEEEETTNE